MGSGRDRKVWAGAVAALALVIVPIALAGGQPVVRLNPADQAAAKAATLKLSDFVSGFGWKGGAKKPSFAADNTCGVERSDLVITGAARSEFSAAGGAAQVRNETYVLETPGMVSAEWQRSVGSAAFWACQLKEYAKPAPDFKLVSFKKVAFPKLTRYSARYRLVADFGKPGSARRMVSDTVVLGHGRNEITLVFAAPYADRAGVEWGVRQLAQLLVSRIGTSPPVDRREVGGQSKGQPVGGRRFQLYDVLVEVTRNPAPT